MYDFPLIARLAGEVVIGHVVPEVVELAVLLLIDYFLVAEGGQGLGVPVDHAHAAVDESFII